MVVLAMLKANAESFSPELYISILTLSPKPFYFAIPLVIHFYAALCFFTWV
jgi:hypothetical protein